MITAFFVHPPSTQFSLAHMTSSSISEWTEPAKSSGYLSLQTMFVPNRVGWIRATRPLKKRGQMALPSVAQRWVHLDQVTVGPHGFSLLDRQPYGRRALSVS